MADLEQNVTEALLASIETRILRTLRDYRQTEVADEDGNGYPLVDALTLKGRGIDMGEREIDNIVGELMYEIAAALRQSPSAAPVAVKVPYPPIVMHKDGKGVDHRVGVHEYRTVDRPDGGAITISVFLGNHTWAEATLDPQSARVVSDLILSKPSVAALPAASPIGGAHDD